MSARSLGSALLAIVPVLCMLPCVPVPEARAGTTRTLRVEALVDGRSQLRLSRNTAQWHHLDYAAPGRHEFRDEPTLLDGVAWFPTWPDVPDRENRGCGCRSSIYPGVSPPLAAAAGQVVLRAIRTRWPPHVIETPGPANGYTLVVELDDRGFTAADWYVFEIDFTPDNVPFAAFETVALGLSLGAGSGPDDACQVAGRFALDASSDGIDPAREPVVLRLGDAALSIPPGSFVENGAGLHWEGSVDGAAVSATVMRLGVGSYAFAISARGVDLTTIHDPEAVRLVVGDDEGEAVVPLAGRLGFGEGIVVGPPR